MQGVCRGCARGGVGANDMCAVGVCVGVCKDGVGVSTGRAQGGWRCSWCCTRGSVGVQGWGLQCPGAVLLDPGAAPPPGLQLLPVELWERLYQHRAESKGWAALAHAPVSSGEGARDFPAVLGAARPLPLAPCLQLVLGWRGHSRGCRGTGSWRAPGPFVGFMAAVGRGSPVPLATPCVVGAARRSCYRGQTVVVAVTPSVLAPARPRDSACRDLCPMGTAGWAQHWDPASHQHPASHQELGSPWPCHRGGGARLTLQSPPHPRW